MIDWLSCRIELPHTTIRGGFVMKIDPDGAVEWESPAWLDVVGSHDQNLRLRTAGPGRLDLSGNPVKWLQGHNVFGSGDLHGLLVATLSKLVRLGILPPGLDARTLGILAGRATVSRIDVTGMYELPSLAAVRSWLKAAESSAYLRHRGRGTLTREGTLYFGKGSRRSMLKIYCKGDELAAHKLPEKLPYREAVETWAQNKLRVELQLRSLALKDRNLDTVAAWGDNDPSMVLNEYLSGLDLTAQMPLTAPELEKIPSHLRSSYQHWFTGVDLRTILSRRTWYRHRRELLAFGVDIAVRRPVEQPKAVPQLRTVLEARPVSVPDWAYGTAAFFEPDAIAA